MLEYTLDDAEVLLKKNCEQVCCKKIMRFYHRKPVYISDFDAKNALLQAEQNLAQIAWDLDYLRDQMTITEVDFLLQSLPEFFLPLHSLLHIVIMNIAF